MSDDERTVWCGNLSDKVTEELLYELFLQAAPLERVRIPTDKDGRKSNFAFITMKHEISVNYAVQLLHGTSLFEKRLNVKRRNTGQSQISPRILQNKEPITIMENFNDLFKMGQLMQLNYCNYLREHTDNRQEHNNHSNGRHRDDFKQKHYNNRYDTYNSNRHGRSNHNNRSGNRNYERRHRPY